MIKDRSTRSKVPGKKLNHCIISKLTPKLKPTPNHISNCLVILKPQIIMIAKLRDNIHNPSGKEFTIQEGKRNHAIAKNITRGLNPSHSAA
jgi:hypothetical protein